MTHPLHPKLIDALSEYKTCPEAMQAAADWQLEQVMKWLEETKYDYTYDAHEDPERVFDYMDDKLKKLRKAMRPTQEKN